MRDRIETFFLFATAGISIVISCLDLSGLLQGFPFLAERTSTLSLLVIGIVTGYLALERRSKLDKIDEQVTALEQRFSQANAFFNLLGERDHFAEVAFIYGLRSYGKLISEKSIEVGRDHVHDLWRDCIRGCRRWLALHYVTAEESWGIGWQNTLSQGIQEERILSGATIKRVFIVDDEDEYRRIMTIMKDQQAIQIDVRWLLKSDLLSNHLVAGYIKDLGTLDVSLADDSWVYRVYLDKTRRLTRGNAIKQREIVEKAKFVFNEAFTKGKML